jgi:WD40 repeat protein
LVFSARFSPDGRHIVTGSQDGRVRVWASDTGEELQMIAGHLGAVWSVAFAPMHAQSDRAVEKEITPPKCGRR